MQHRHWNRPPPEGARPILGKIRARYPPIFLSQNVDSDFKRQASGLGPAARGRQARPVQWPHARGIGRLGNGTPTSPKVKQSLVAAGRSRSSPIRQVYRAHLANSAGRRITGKKLSRIGARRIRGTIALRPSASPRDECASDDMRPAADRFECSCKRGRGNRRCGLLREARGRGRNRPARQSPVRTSVRRGQAQDGATAVPPPRVVGFAGQLARSPPQARPNETPDRPMRLVPSLTTRLTRSRGPRLGGQALQTRPQSQLNAAQACSLGWFKSVVGLPVCRQTRGPHDWMSMNSTVNSWRISGQGSGTGSALSAARQGLGASGGIQAARIHVQRPLATHFTGAAGLS